MEVPVATTFDDYVTLIAANSPHDLVMDWWRRLYLALRDYGRTLRPVVDAANRDAIEKALSQDPSLGPAVASLVCELRRVRNRVAHESICLSGRESEVYARRAFSLIAVIARRV